MKGSHKRTLEAVTIDKVADTQEADGTLAPWLDKSSVGGSADELHGNGTAPPLGIYIDRVEQISRTVVVRKALELCRHPEEQQHSQGCGRQSTF
jgi:hypothetical protein